VKASRLLSILMLLQARGHMTAPALAAALEVSERTILRDIDHLSAAGVPLWGDRGRNGGFQLRAGWSTQLTGMTEPEANALLLAGLPGAATELGLGAAAASARLKLVASLPAEWREQADRVGSRLHIDSVDWYRTQETPVYLRELAGAVWNSMRVKIKYESWNSVVNRELDPLGLILKAGAWYIAARTAGEIKVRTYRVSNVLELIASRKHFKRPAKFELADYWRESATRFEAELYRLQAKIRVSPRAMKWLLNARIKVTILPPEFKRARDKADWKIVLMPIESIEHGARQLLAFGGEIEVLEPLELRAKIIEDAHAIIARHVVV
jgi:predicted DNA-binding transcriptional regulator YafY